MEGYVIISLEGKYLDVSIHWVWQRSEDAHIFSLDETEKILAEAKKKQWKTMPEYIVPAKTRDGQVVIDGHVELAYSLPIIL